MSTHTFCPECGWGVPVDEDGCCVTCGNGATGAAVDVAARERAEWGTLNARLRAAVEARDDRIIRRSNNGITCRYCGVIYEDDHAENCVTLTHPLDPATTASDAPGKALDEAIAEAVLDFLAGQTYGGESILQDVIACDYASRQHMIAALSRVIRKTLDPATPATAKEVKP